MVLLRLITDGPTSVNYGWSYFHMDSPTDKNPADSGLLPSIWMVLRINHLDLSLIVLRINPADCGRRTLDLSLALRTASVNYGWSYG